MLTLYIVRHAKSDWGNAHISDIDRPLNERGYRDATAVSAILKTQQICPDLVLSSPAVRALSTALIFARTLNYNANKIQINKKLYNTDVETYLSTLIEVPEKVKSIMLFGHNPVVSELANKLSGLNNEEMSTCSIVGIKFKTNNWEEIEKQFAELILFDSPKNIGR